LFACNYADALDDIGSDQLSTLAERDRIEVSARPSHQTLGDITANEVVADLLEGRSRSSPRDPEHHRDSDPI
jgi:hypothetical protein